MRKFHLDDPALISQHDKSNMFGRIYELPDHLEAARAAVEAVELPVLRTVEAVVVTGLGGSADLLRSYAGDKCIVPILVNRHYTLPQFVGPTTLVLCVSYSGNTEETLAAYEDAKARGAQIAAITSGGELGRRAAEDRFPVLTVPGGLQPRAALGYLFVPQLLLLACNRLLFEQDVRIELAETIALLTAMRERLKPDSPQAVNEAKQLALGLSGRIPIVHSASGLTEIVSYRWKTQINENAQSLAFAHYYPELNHNEVVGFDVPVELVEKVDVITLHADRNHPRVRRRMEITNDELLAATGCRRWHVHAQGESDLAQLFSLVYIGDYMSAYLALTYGFDPTPVDKINLLKNRLIE
jgi:glucose/mannose-6-phosphate isomerase